jgi:hypothetical protein
MIRLIRQLLARRRLQRMVEANRNSFRTQLFVKNREAQIQRRPQRMAALSSANLGEMK